MSMLVMPIFVTTDQAQTGQNTLFLQLCMCLVIQPCMTHQEYFRTLPRFTQSSSHTFSKK